MRTQELAQRAELRTEAATSRSPDACISLYPEKQQFLTLRYLLLLLLSRFSRVRLCAAPQTATHQALPSLRFSRQEHWSGLPFPSPMHESEKIVRSLSRVQLLATPWTAAHEAPPSMGFSRQESSSGLPLPSPLEISGFL